jgi:hypothetical protein
MPFVDDIVASRNLANIEGPEMDRYDPSMAETFGAAFRTQNIVGSWLSSRGVPDQFEIEDGFNAIDYVKDDPTYSPYVDQFAQVFNRKAADTLKLQIDSELQDRRTLDAAGGMGVFAELAAGVVDLPTLLPVGGVVASGVRSTAGRFALGAGLDAAASEAGLQATQRTRTGEETAINIGGSVILGGALGVLAGRFLDTPSQIAISRKIEAQGDEFDAVTDSFVSAGRAVSAGAAARDVGPLKLKDEALISKLPVVNQQDPMIRLQLSDLDEARGTVRGLAETPLEYADNAKGIATEEGGSVETRMKMWHAPMANTLRNIDTAYARYFHGTPEPSSWQVRLSPARSEFERLTGNRSRLTFQQFKEEVSKAAFSGEQHSIPEVAMAAKEYRAIDDAMKRAAIEAGLFPEDIAVKGDVSHLFRMYNQQKIVARRDEFARILEEHFTVKRDEARRIAELQAKVADTAAKADKKADDFGNLSDAEVRSLVDETVNTILGNAEGRIPYDIVSGPRGPLKERLLSIESGRIQGFLELDIEKVLQAQVRTMSADVELAKKFGSVDLKEQIRKINDEADAKVRQATTEKDRVRLDKARKDAIRDVEGIRDRLRGQYALPSNPDSLVLRAGRVVRNINYLRLLGGMTVSAIPDMAKPVFEYGLLSTFKDGFLPMITNFRGFRAAAGEVKAAGTALDMILDSRTMAMADIGDNFGRHSKFERGLQAATNRFGIVSFMAPWNATIKQFTGMISMNNMLRATEAVAAGKATQKQIARLASSGINEDMAARIAKQFAKHGDKDGGISLAQAAEWSDRGAREAFRAAVVREVDKTIVTPGQDKPLWMSTELGKVIGQFKSFGMSSAQKTMLSGIQRRDAATLNGVMIMLGLGALTYQFKSTLAGKETSAKPSVWVAESVDKSGLTGWLMDANNVVEKVTRGHVGISALTGEQISRYASRNATASLLGPSLGTVQDFLDVIGAGMTGEFGKKDMHKMRQLVPAQNVFYLRTLFDRVEKATGDTMGLQ